MRTVQFLTRHDRHAVWRCADCTLAWREDAKVVNTRVNGGTTTVGAWCRLDTLGSPTWTPLTYMPAGPFHELPGLDYSDYRNAPKGNMPPALRAAIRESTFGGQMPDFTPTFPRQANTPLLGWPGPNE